MKPASITYASFVLAFFLANRFDVQSVSATIREGNSHWTGISHSQHYGTLNTLVGSIHEWQLLRI